ncbi:hypothetical protein J6590_080888 [Homalodisca vitripennis]|nr:hypothetical protein J6590_080888 [Homalodisca vitripennis]
MVKNTQTGLRGDRARQQLPLCGVGLSHSARDTVNTDISLGVEIRLIDLTVYFDKNLVEEGSENDFDCPLHKKELFCNIKPIKGQISKELAKIESDPCHRYAFVYFTLMVIPTGGNTTSVETRCLVCIRPYATPSVNRIFTGYKHAVFNVQRNYPYIIDRGNPHCSPASAFLRFFIVFRCIYNIRRMVVFFDLHGFVKSCRGGHGHCSRYAYYHRCDVTDVDHCLSQLCSNGAGAGTANHRLGCTRVEEPDSDVIIGAVELGVTGSRWAFR